jgi:6-phosphogluconolactonase
MRVDAVRDGAAVARTAAALIAAAARAAVGERGRFVFAVSGGRTPFETFRELARQDVPWPGVHVVQVDERVAPAGHADRNLVGLREALIPHAPLGDEQIHAMPVEAADLDAAAASYARTLETLAGSPPILDLVHLGLGADGHTASLIPGDPVVGIGHTDVALAGEYMGRRRMTLTYPALNRARAILWIVSGGEKAPMLRRLVDGDTSIPAGLVNRSHAVLVTDVSL